MKKFILLISVIIAVTVTVNAQIKGKVITLTATEADSSKGTETDYQYIPNADGFKEVVNLTIQSLFTQLGGTTDGTVTIQATGDGTNYFPVTTANCSACQFSNANDTVTMTNAGTWRVVIPATYDYKYRLKIEGTSGDTTLLTTKFLYKDIPD